MVYANRGSLLTASEGEPGGPDLAGGAFVPDPAAGAAALAEPVLPPRLGPASRSRLQRSSCGREGGFRRLREGPRGRVRDMKKQSMNLHSNLCLRKIYLLIETVAIIKDAIPTREEQKKQTAAAAAAVTACYTFPKSRPVANHTLQPLSRLLPLRGEKPALSEKHDATAAAGACVHTLNEDGEKGAVCGPCRQRRGRRGGHVQSAFGNAGE
ncbi:hypothetical protein MG293_012051 [Ovis ammon polii]|uniref:Uncharacterized protein n=1 Tax=Ovis ammon polii TaxID=230172 RepID=A0AAD4U0A8_OVIAM|nr:hypothetical protein MG293_012051 [Ovis ammon polii]